jgi:hypothetical protein
MEHKLTCDRWVRKPAKESRCSGRKFVKVECGLKRKYRAPVITKVRNSHPLQVSVDLTKTGCQKS